MIALLLLMAAQAAEPELRVDSETFATAAPDITPEIAPMVDQYYHCAFPDAFGNHHVVIGKEEANARAQIAKCASVRASAIRAAIAAYKYSAGGDPDGNAFVNRAFDTVVDEAQIYLAKHLDGFDAGVPGSNAGATLPPVQDRSGEIERAVRAMNDRLGGWGATIDNSGRLETCKTTSSSGDAELDAIGCRAMSDCAIKMQAIAARLDDPSVSDADKQKLARDSSGAVTTCVMDRRSELLTGLALTRVLAAKEVHPK
jgi:hypothetical protein